jgi:P pilus assembly chaperone PapD
MRKAILSMLFLAGISAGAWAVGFVLTPPRFEVSLASGATQTYNISVLNVDSTAPVKLRAYLMDWTMKTTGQMAFSKAGTGPYSNAGWIDVNPAEFEVPPLAEQVVRFTVRVPDSSFGSRWSMLYFESQPDTSQKAMIGVLFKARVGAPIYVTIPGTEVKQAELLGFAYKRKGVQSHEFKLQIANTGNVHLRPTGTLVIRDGGGAAVATLTLSNDVVLPQSQRDLVLPLAQALAPGRYTAVISLDCGTPELIQGETAFEVAQ